MFTNLKPQLDEIFNNGPHYAQDAIETRHGLLYDANPSELTEDFWKDLREVLLEGGIAAPEADQFLTSFQEELQLRNPYLSKVALVRPLFEEAVRRNFPQATF